MGGTSTGGHVWELRLWVYFDLLILTYQNNYLESYIQHALFMLFITVYIMLEMTFPFLWLLRSQPFYFNRGGCFILQQEDKEPVFDSTKTIIGMLEVCAEFAQNITFNREKIKKALPAGYLDATTLADYLVKKVSHFPRNLLSIFFFTCQKHIYIS